MVSINVSPQPLQEDIPQLVLVALVSAQCELSSVSIMSIIATSANILFALVKVHAHT